MKNKVFLKLKSLDKEKVLVGFLAGVALSLVFGLLFYAFIITLEEVR